MPVFYALVARKTTVLAEYTGRSGNFPTVTRMLLGKILDGDQKQSYVYDKCVHFAMAEKSREWPSANDEARAFFIELFYPRLALSPSPPFHSATCSTTSLNVALHTCASPTRRISAASPFCIWMT